MAKIASLLLAIALWFLINENLREKGSGPLFPENAVGQPTGEL